MKEFITIIGALTPLFLGIFGFYFNWKMNKTKLEQEKALKDRDDVQDKKLEIKFNKIIERQQELESSSFEIKELLKAHLTDTETKDFFDEALKKATEGEALSMIKNNFEIGVARKSMVTKWGNIMLNFAQNFFRNETRKMNELRRGEVLAEQQAIIIADFNNYINQKAGSVKTLKGKKVRFSDFIEEYRVYASFEILILDLKRNNLSEKEYISKFETQVNTFCRALIIAQSEWKELEFNSMFNKEDAA